MVSLQRSPIPLLQITVLGVALALARVMFDAHLGQTQPYVFPSYVPLAQAHLVNSGPITAPHRQHAPTAIRGQRYDYLQRRDRQPDLPISLEMYYFPAANGDVAEYLDRYPVTPIALNPKTVVPKQDQSGFYTLFETQGKAYLSTCVNSQGPTTVTREQFLANRTTYDLQLSRLLPVLIGQADVRDSRCLWVNLSMPTQPEGLEVTYQQLTAVWQTWYAGWSPQFPRM